LTAERWRWRGVVALAGVALAFVLFPLTPSDDVINSDWPAFATGAKLIVSDPPRLYDLDAQQHVQREITGGRQLVTLGIHGILPFLAPAWVALLAVPFSLAGADLGGRLWVLFGLACLALGIWLATRPRPWREALPAFAGVPTALVMLNAQLDGLVVLGLGAAIALWKRPYLAGAALGLTLMKPQLVLPLGAGLLVTRQWRPVAAWAAAGVVMWASGAIFDWRWVMDWLSQTGGTVTSGSREVDLPHLGTLLPAELQAAAVAVLTVFTVIGVIALTWRAGSFQRMTAVLVAGGVLAAPHALPADLVLVALALAVWGEAEWHDWLVLSIAAALCAITPAPLPVLIGAPVMVWLLLRISAVIEWRTSRRQPLPQAASSG
jgi:hypothetical protein